ncbi:MAG: hypothetical protein MZV65_46400 [Chromatiales bacterium]|nr:hypothetical protein [Chromatiales bacterium]MCK7582304.1 hypothetical protein [Chromatiales bacterium]
MLSEEGRIAFVSAKNYRDQVSVPGFKTKNSFTEDWNIDNVRNTLANYVSSKINVLQSIRAEQSDLEINRKQRVIESCKSLCATYFGLNKTLKSRIRG